MMVLVPEWNEFFLDEEIFFKNISHARYGISALPYFPVMLAIEDMPPRIRDLEREMHFWQEGDFKRKLYRRPEMRQTDNNTSFRDPF